MDNQIPPEAQRLLESLTASEHTIWAFFDSMKPASKLLEEYVFNSGGPKAAERRRFAAALKNRAEQCWDRLPPEQRKPGATKHWANIKRYLGEATAVLVMLSGNTSDEERWERAHELIDGHPRFPVNGIVEELTALLDTFADPAVQAPPDVPKDSELISLATAAKRIRDLAEHLRATGPNSPLKNSLTRVLSCGPSGWMDAVKEDAFDGIGSARGAAAG